jgi:N-acetylmuramic acid 6-phosphate etherase
LRPQTEQLNPSTIDMDLLPPTELMRLLHAENYVPAQAVEAALPQIVLAVEVIAERLKKGGRLFYIGAGTSGRIGVLDASECPPTFGVPPEMVQGIIAGGDVAMRESLEGAEDDPEAGARDLRARGLSSADVIVGIAASGRTPYVVGALKQAREAGAYTIALVNTSPSEMERLAELTIIVLTGPEALAGSTRLKAGTAQKMVLNLLSTGAMVLLGKTYGNLMVDVQATNTKLQERAVQIVRVAAGVDEDRARCALEQAQWRAKTAIVMLTLGITAEEANMRIEQAGGFVRKALLMAHSPSSTFR